MYCLCFLWAIPGFGVAPPLVKLVELKLFK